MGFAEPADMEGLRQQVARDVGKYRKDVRTSMGYPRSWLPRCPNFRELYNKVRDFAINNLGNWEDRGLFVPNSFVQEGLVMDFFYDLWKCPDPKNYWGYFEANGTLPNVWMAALGMQALIRNCPTLVKASPDGKPTVHPIILASKDSHYSLGTATLVTNLDVHHVDSNADGSVNIGLLKAAIATYSERPIIVFLTTGTTVKQGRDDIYGALQAAADSGRPRHHFFFHCDAAFDGVSLPLLKKAAEEIEAGTVLDDPRRVEFNALLKGLPEDFLLKNITPSFSLVATSSKGEKFDLDSISASGHKFPGTMDPCSVHVMRREYTALIKRDIEYIQGQAMSLSGSRPGVTIYEFWLLLSFYGTNTMTDWAIACANKAASIAQTMRDNGITDVLLNPLATTIYFPQPSQELMQLHHLAPDEKRFCHAIIANHTLGEFGGYGTADHFLNNLLKERRGQQG